MRFTLLFLLVCSHAWAWIHKPEAGLGFTNNANYESSNTDSDLYWWLRNFSSTGEEKQFSIWVSYRDYIKESQNDVFNWRGGYTMPAFPKWQADFGAGGQHYTSTSPGTTEENVGYLYGDASLLREFELRSNLNLSIEPGYQIKGYTDLATRTDHRFYFLGTLNFDFHPKHNVTPYSEVGVIVSSDSLYSRNYFSLGGDWTWLAKSDLKVGAGLHLRYTTYPNRTVSVPTAISRRRNSYSVSSRDEAETHSYTLVQGQIIKSFAKFDLKGVVYSASQNSKSGFEDYSEQGIRASIIFTF